MDRRERASLKIKEGKFMTVRKLQDGLKLCAVEHQNEEYNAPSVYILRHDNRMALLFKHGNNYYLPEVDGKNLKLVVAADGTMSDYATICDRSWFEKENLGCGEHYGLRSVVEPRRYLSMSLSQRMMYIFILSEIRQECVQVTDKRIG